MKCYVLAWRRRQVCLTSCRILPDVAQWRWTENFLDSHYEHVRFKLKNAVFWDVAAPCGFIINRRFGGTCRLHLQGRRNNASEENYRLLATVWQFSSLPLFFLPWRWRRHVPPKRRFIINPHGATSQRMAFFIVTAVKTSIHARFKLSCNYRLSSISRAFPQTRQLWQKTNTRHYSMECDYRKDLNWW
jgi:hypothetical protein